MLVYMLHVLWKTSQVLVFLQNMIHYRSFYFVVRFKRDNLASTGSSPKWAIFCLPRHMRKKLD